MGKLIRVSAAVIFICVTAALACGFSGTAEQPEQNVTPVPDQEPVSDVLLNESANNTTVNVTLDTEIRLELHGNPTTGYLWLLETTPGVVVINESYIPDDESGRLVGSGGTFVWTLQAAQPGNQQVKGIYARPWVSSNEDWIIFNVTLDVCEVPNITGVYTEADSRRTVNESLGHEFNVRLAENPTTGYAWNFSASAGLDPVRNDYIASNASGMVLGSGGVRSVYYNATEIGEQALHGEYRRPWLPSGTVTFVGLEGGFYGITGNDGTHYYPLQMEEQYMIDGLRVAFYFEPVKDMATIGMWGEPVELVFIENITTFDLSVSVA